MQVVGGPLADGRLAGQVLQESAPAVPATVVGRGTSNRTAAKRRRPTRSWPPSSRRLDALIEEATLAAVPGNRLEALAGDRKGQHSIRVNQQYRITFRWEGHDAHDVCCEDYH